MGRIGDGQLVFNRYKLSIFSGKSPVGKLDEIAHTEDIASPQLASRLLQSYLPADLNGGFEKQMSYSDETTKRKLTLVELSSTRTGRTSRLAGGCRDESTDRFRKVYRIERDGEAPLIVPLACMEYQLSTRGGRTCR